MDGRALTPLKALYVRLACTIAVRRRSGRPHGARAYYALLVDSTPD